MSCTPPVIVVGGVPISTNDFVNAREIMTTVSGDGGDPTHDEYEENIANGNNTAGTSGIQIPAPAQTTPPAPIPETPKEKSEIPPPNNNPTPVVCTTWDGDYNFQLSTNFRVRDFTVGAVFPNPLTDRPGFSRQVRCCNLQGLAVNVAEPIRAKFGPFRVNSGIRNSSSGSGVSQHIKGEAMDIQFPGWTYDRYWQNAEWIKNNIPYDQFIFEHSDKTGLAWYHLSFNRAGNRPVTNANKVMTMYRNNYSPGLRKFF